MRLYPIKLSAHVRTYSFGDRLIPDRLGKPGLPDGTVAETWEISDYRDTTGTVTNGYLAGRTLHDLVMQHPDEIVGRGWRGPHFPLLAKFLDATHMLPVHLHADDETARRKYGEPNGKTEAWHILWAHPGATILAGIKPNTSDDDLLRAFMRADYDAVMFRYPIQRGDTVYVPGGTLHSFGPDTLIFEIQQTSDLGQSVMPNDLYGHPLSPEEWRHNIGETMDELRREFFPRPNSGLGIWDGENQFRVGCAGPHFALERWTLSRPHRESMDGRHCFTLSVVSGSVSLQFAEGTEQLVSGESCLLPAGMGPVWIDPDTLAELVVCYVPDLAIDIVDRLIEAEHAPHDIASLGEVYP